MRRVLLVACGSLLIVGSGARAQVGGYSDVPPSHWAATAVSKLATMGVMMPDKTKKVGTSFDGAKPVTRYELALTLWRFVQYLEGADKQKRGKTQALAPKSGAEAMQKLVAGGYLPKNSPLVSAGAATVSAQQLADALSQVIVKVRSHKVPITPESEKAPIVRTGPAT